MSARELRLVKLNAARQAALQAPTSPLASTMSDEDNQPPIQNAAPQGGADLVPPPRYGGGPIMPLFAGFADKETVEDFFYYWGIQSVHVHPVHKKGELLRCLDRPSQKALRDSGLDVPNASYDEVVARMKLIFGRPRLTVSEAQARLRALTLKPGQSAYEFQAEINSLAIDANERDQARLIELFYENLPLDVKLNLGEYPKADEDLAAFTKRVAVPLGILARYQRSSVNAFPAASTSQAITSYPTPRHGRNQNQSSNPFRGRSKSRQPPENRGRGSGQRDFNHRSKSRGRSASRGPPGSASRGKFTGSCWFCNFKGHRHQDCRKRKAAIDAGDPNPVLNYRPHSVHMIGPIGSSPGQSYVVKLALGSSTANAIADTGSEYSIIRSNLIPKELINNVTKVNLTVPVANGAKLRFNGIFLTNVSALGSRPTEVRFYVSDDLLPDAILGVQALGALRIIFDCEKRSMTIRNEDPPAPGLPVFMIASSTSAAPVFTLSGMSPPPGMSNSPATIEKHAKRNQASTAVISYGNTLRPDSMEPFIQTTVPSTDPTDADYPMHEFDKIELNGLIINFHSIFSSDERKSTIANTTPAVITLKRDARLPFVDHGGPSLTLKERALIDDQIKIWQFEGIIESSTSNNRTYLLVAYNKSGKPRICPAFLSLNAATVFHPYPMPTADSIRQRVGNASIFCCIDIKSAFTSIPLDIKSRDLTTFVHNDRKYRFTRSQWGLLNSATLFQQYIDTVVGDSPGVHVYMDDILVFASEPRVLLARLQTLFKQLQTARLLINTEKCKFFKTVLPYLGNILEHGAIRPDPARVEAIIAWEFPATTSEMRSFVGAAAMLSSYCPDYGYLKGLLHPLLSTKKAYLPTQLQIDAFNELKRAILDAGMLHQPDCHKPMYLRTDASTIGLGAVLYQLADDGEQILPLYYLSRALHDVETRYDARKLELLAIKWALTRLRNWVIACKKLTVITDHESLIHCMTLVNQNSTMSRWISAVSEYNPTIEYRPGNTNHLADFLSRHPILDSEPPDGDCDLQSERVAAFQLAVSRSSDSSQINTVYTSDVDSPSDTDGTTPSTTRSNSPQPVPSETSFLSDSNESELTRISDPIWLNHDVLIRYQSDDRFCKAAIKSLSHALQLISLVPIEMFSSSSTRTPVYSSLLLLKEKWSSWPPKTWLKAS